MHVSYMNRIHVHRHQHVFLELPDLGEKGHIRAAFDRVMRRNVSYITERVM